MCKHLTYSLPDNKLSFHHDLLLRWPRGILHAENSLHSPSSLSHFIGCLGQSLLFQLLFFSAHISVVASHLHCTCPPWGDLSALWPLCSEQDILSEEKQEQSFEMNPFKGHLV